MGIDDDLAFDDYGHNNCWEFNNLTRFDPESNEIPGGCNLGLDVPKIVIVHGETNIPDWVQLYVSPGGCFLMSMQCFTTHAEFGYCLKHFPNISMHKQLYISGHSREKWPKAVRAVESIAAEPFSHYRILTEARKDVVIAKARANAAKKKNQMRNIWLVSTKERDAYAGLSNVVNDPKFTRTVTRIDRSLSLTGLCGR